MGKLIYHNDAVLDFINENYLMNMRVFESNLIIKAENSKNNFKVYISNSIRKDQHFTLVKNNTENFSAFILKPYVSQNGPNIEYFHNLLQEIDNQWRYLDYIKSQENNIKIIEQLVLVFKSLHRIKVFTASNVDFYENPQVISNEKLDLIIFIQNFLIKMENIYNLKSFNIQYFGENYMGAFDKILLERALLYFFEFFSSFFLLLDKSINIQVEDDVFVLAMNVKQKFDFKNSVNTRLIFVMQKLFKLMKFTVNLVDEENKFSFLISYDRNR
jgi:hypothetical protein